MKQIIFSFLLLNSFNLFGQDSSRSFPENNILFKNLRINLQANVLQEVKLNNSITDKKFFLNNNFSTGIEFVFGYKESINFGIGALLQLKSEIDTAYGEVGMLPVYAFVDFPLTDNTVFPIQLSIQFGYAPLILNNGMKKVSDGIYHAFGLTTVISKNVQLKLLYANNYGKVKLYDEEYFFRKGNLTLAFYFKF
jgi:hypothetical protein